MMDIVNIRGFSEPGDERGEVAEPPGHEVLVEAEAEHEGPAMHT